ncbi:pentatricopeptide repeat-containing protein At4g02750-like [Selaginella moellendorffii]|uniref:pentatricopeptide repeat-containing protein At4g02750-like n=1 Tax=Selaginella moellendorffii TaxID=88036 RepID=UPI000D1C2EA7|nr:pentatricopeptide repeat-containing protein At4g02750-like [Selaginella moellendorffii]|eukprot:XP_024515861.1 pentatricopeptide repeat-containing protein At4g02750-like [Selaginella moellendorffii]
MPAIDPFSITTILGVLGGRIDGLRHSRALFDRLPQHSLVCCNAMLAIYSQHGKIQEAERLFFDEMRERDIVSCGSMLALYSNSQDRGRATNLRAAKAIYDRMPRHNLVTATAMIDGYAARGDLESALWLLDSIPAKDLVLLTAVLSACAKMGLVEEARKIFHQAMPEHDMASWNTVVSMLSQSGRIYEAKAMFDEFPERNRVCWTAIAAAYAQNGHLDQAKKIFDRMPDRNLVAWSSLLAGFADGSRLGEVMTLFDAMKLLDEIGETIFVLVLSALSQAGKLEAGRSCFLSMVGDFGVEPCKQHYSCLVDLLCRVGHLRNARELICSMPFVPDFLEWTTLFGARRNHDDVRASNKEQPGKDFGLNPRALSLLSKLVLIRLAVLLFFFLLVAPEFLQLTEGTSNGLLAVEPVYGRNESEVHGIGDERSPRPSEAGSASPAQISNAVAVLPVPQALEEKGKITSTFEFRLVDTVGKAAEGEQLTHEEGQNISDLEVLKLTGEKLPNVREYLLLDEIGEAIFVLVLSALSQAGKLELFSRADFDTLKQS